MKIHEPCAACTLRCKMRWRDDAFHQLATQRSQAAELGLVFAGETYCHKDIPLVEVAIVA